MNVTPFNGLWFAYIALLVALSVGLHFTLRRRTRRVQAWTLSGIAAANVVIYTAFTFQAIGNPAYPQVTLAQNLPFHFCNLMAWALIFAPLLRWRWLYSLVCFPGVLAGALALTSPVDVYLVRPLFSLAALGFYGVHTINAALGVLLVTLGFFEATWRQSLRSVAFFGAMAVLVFPLNLALRAWVDPDTNYFYEFAPENAEILALVHGWVPVPLLYLTLLAPIAFGGCLAIAGIYALAGKLMGHPVGQSPVQPRAHCAVAQDRVGE